VQSLELHAGISQSGEADHGGFTQSQPGIGGEGKQVDATRGEVFADLTRPDVEPGLAQFIEQLGVNEMDLSQIRRAFVSRPP